MYIIVFCLVGVIGVPTPPQGWGPGTGLNYLHHTETTTPQGNRKGYPVPKGPPPTTQAPCPYYQAAVGAPPGVMPPPGYVCRPPTTTTTTTTTTARPTPPPCPPQRPCQCRPCPRPTPVPTVQTTQHSKGYPRPVQPGAQSRAGQNNYQYATSQSISSSLSAWQSGGGPQGPSQSFQSSVSMSQGGPNGGVQTISSRTSGRQGRNPSAPALDRQPQGDPGQLQPGNPHNPGQLQPGSPHNPGYARNNQNPGMQAGRRRTYDSRRQRPGTPNMNNVPGNSNVPWNGNGNYQSFESSFSMTQHGGGSQSMDASNSMSQLSGDADSRGHRGQHQPVNANSGMGRHSGGQSMNINRRMNQNLGGRDLFAGSPYYDGDAANQQSTGQPAGGQHGTLPVGGGPQFSTQPLPEGIKTLRAMRRHRLRHYNSLQRGETAGYVEYSGPGDARYTQTRQYVDSDGRYDRSTLEVLPQQLPADQQQTGQNSIPNGQEQLPAVRQKTIQYHLPAGQEQLPAVRQQTRRYPLPHGQGQLPAVRQQINQYLVPDGQAQLEVPILDLQYQQIHPCPTGCTPAAQMRQPPYTEGSRAKKTLETALQVMLQGLNPPHTGQGSMSSQPRDLNNNPEEITLERSYNGPA